jgi:hypothetical protein
MYTALIVLSPVQRKIITDITKYALLMSSPELDGFFGMTQEVEN